MFFVMTDSTELLEQATRKLEPLVRSLPCDRVVSFHGISCAWQGSVVSTLDLATNPSHLEDATSLVSPPHVATALFQNTSTTHINQKPGRSRTLYPSLAILAASHNGLQEAAEPTFLDWFLFSQVDEAVISVGSNFGFTAAMRRLQTPVTVWHSGSALLAWRLCISGGGHASCGVTD
jgi:hypothetical protein